MHCSRGIRVNCSTLIPQIGQHQNWSMRGSVSHKLLGDAEHGQRCSSKCLQLCPAQIHPELPSEGMRSLNLLPVLKAVVGLDAKWGNPVPEVTNMRNMIHVALVALAQEQACIP